LNDILISDEKDKIEISKRIISGEEKSPYDDLVSLNAKVVREILLK